MTRTRRILLWVLLPLGLLILLPMCAVGLLFTDSGSRWLLERVPGLTVENYQGALLGQWQAERLEWQDMETRAELSQVAMTLDAGCLWRGAVCLEQLQVQSLSLELSTVEETADEPPQDVLLPDISLPVSVKVGQLAIGELRLNGEPLLRDLNLVASADGNQLELQTLSLNYDAYHASLSGQLQLNKNWPLQLLLEAGGELPDLGTQQLRLELDGELQRQINFSGSFSGAVTGSLTGQTQPLLASLPASVQLALTRLELQKVLPEGLAVENLKLSADGSLEQGFTWQLDSALQAQQEAFTLTARGQADTLSVQAEQLLLAATSGPGYMELQAKASWADDLRANATVGIEQFPWQHFAGLDEAPVSVDSARLQFDYANEHYQGKVQASMQGPAGPFSVDSQLQGDSNQVQVQPLQIIAGSGQVQGGAQVSWDKAVSWASTLDIKDLNPAYWVADWPGTLDGHVRSSGELAEQLKLTAELQLNGQLRKQKLASSVRVNAQGEHWQLPELDIRLGDNRIHGQVQLDERLAGELSLALPRLDQLQPGAAGRLQGRIKLSGTLEQPDADIQLNGSRIAFEGQRIRDLKLTGYLRQGNSGSLDLSARGLASADEQLGQLQLKAGGDLGQHQLTLELKGPLANADLQLSGSLQPDQLHWQGQLQQLQVALENQQWTLEQPLAIDYLHEKYARLAAHCLRSEHGRLCATGQQQLLPQLQLDYRLQEFALASLQPWLSSGLAMEGRLNGQLLLNEGKAGLQGKVLLDAGQGALLLEQEGERFAWNVLAVQADLLPQQIDTRIELQGAEQGQLLVQASIDPRPDSKPLKGSFTLRQLDLNALHGFVADLEHLRGGIEGQGQIGGTLLRPDINGEILLSDGQVGGGMLPVTLEQLQLAIRIAGQQAKLDGSWRSGDNGQASLAGGVSWGEELHAAVSIKGQDLPVYVQPYADLQIAPNLQIQYDDEGLAVTGSISVPRGSITVPELPPDSVSVSSDAVVVGREAAEPDLNVRMNIAIDVGSERLKFSGFGLTSDVQGNLLIADNMSGRGVLELKNGRFRSYGQKLDLRRARLVFSGPLTQPYIDIEAVRVTGDVTAGLRITGLAEQPQAQIFSEPPMAQEQAMSWLLLGKPLGSGGDEGNLMAEAAIGLGLMGALPVTQKLADSLGIEDFQLESEGSGHSTSVVASGQITERLSLRYGVGVFEPGNTLGLRYKLTRRLYLDAASGLANSIDLFYRRNF